MSWKFDEDPTLFRSGLILGLGGRLGFLPGDLKEGVIFEIIYHVGRWLGRYPESLMKTWHYMAENDLVPIGGGSMGGGGGVFL